VNRPTAVRVLFFLAAFFGAVSPALSQAYPNRTIALIVPFVPGGTTDIVARAVITPAPSPAFPGLPTLRETLPGYEVTTWYGLLAPHGTPAPVIQRLYQETAKLLKSPDILKRFEEFGAVPGGESPQQFAPFIKSETAKWTRVAKEAGVTLE
jgi:tripartite-type tricarboxylate transporter receptor subunit TctC